MFILQKVTKPTKEYGFEIAERYLQVKEPFVAFVIFCKSNFCSSALWRLEGYFLGKDRVKSSAAFSSLRRKASFA